MLWERAPLVRPGRVPFAKLGPDLLLLALGSTTLAVDLWKKIPERGRKLLTPVLMALGLVVSTAYLVDGSYNPFLYFRF